MTAIQAITESIESGVLTPYLPQVTFTDVDTDFTDDKLILELWYTQGVVEFNTVLVSVSPQDAAQYCTGDRNTDFYKLVRTDTEFFKASAPNSLSRNQLLKLATEGMKRVGESQLQDWCIERGSLAVVAEYGGYESIEAV